MIGSLGGSILAIKYGYGNVIDNFALFGIFFLIFFAVFDCGCNYRIDYIFCSSALGPINRAI